jgi:trigger factor
MQVTETSAEGLTRELSIVVPTSELETRLDAYLNDLKGRVKLKGFRPGKIPMGHLKRVYGKSAMAEIVNTLIGETTKKTLEDRGERAAVQPTVDLADEEAEKVLAGGRDLAFGMKYEIVPEFEVASLDGIKIERPIVEVSEEEVDERLNELAEGNRPFEPRAEGEAAENGDRLTIGYVGKIDGEPFEGGTDERAFLTLGSGRFIPGFEEQLVGVKQGDEKTISVTFPAEYQAAHLAGKEATFDVTVTEVAKPGELKLDDEWAKSLGMESLDSVKKAIRSQIESQYGFQTRQKVKRQLLDQLDAVYTFDLPPTLVSQELDIIWRQMTQEMSRSGKTFEDEGTTEEQAKADYEKIARRRVRLGLVLSKIGDEANVQVTEPELQRALAAQARQFPGQEKQIFEYYRRPEALASLQAPIFEEKVIDHMLSQVDVTDKTVSKEELMAEDEDPT